MKYTASVAVAMAMMFGAGCATARKVATIAPVGPAPMESAQASGSGSLVVYSAPAERLIDVNMDTWRWNDDFGKNQFMEEEHTDYTIYYANGGVYKHVHNAGTGNPEAPAVVMLPAGTYRVRAEVDCEGTRFPAVMPVVIEPGETTVAHLEGGWKPAVYKDTEVAKLPCGGIVGWRAPE